MNLEELRNYRSSIVSLAKKRHIDNIRIFGSVAKNQEHKKSDIDFLIHMKKEADLLDLSGFKLDLEELIGTPVDVIPDNSIHHLLKKQILSEAVRLDE